MQLARILLYFGFSDMKDIWLHSLTDEKLLEWAYAIGREIDNRWTGPTTETIFRDSRSVFYHYHYKLWAKTQEYLYVLLLDNKNALIQEKLITVGTISCNLIHAREVFAPAIEKRASSLVLIHNHPSGMAIPSEQDIHMTKKLKRVGDLIGIRLLDHIIVGKNQYYSDHVKKILTT